MKNTHILESLKDIKQSLEENLEKSKSTPETYSTDPRGQLAYQVGYLTGSIKNAIRYIEHLESLIQNKK